MPKGEIKGVTFSKSLEEAQGKVLTEYLSLIQEEIVREIKRIIANNELIGEGRTAKVFDITVEHSSIPICVKIWHSHLRDMGQLELQKMQSSSPIGEFELQDQLYLAGFRSVPEPISLTRFEGVSVMAMERVIGYSLKQIIDAGGQIANPKWSDLEKLVVEMHRKYNIAHRDLGPQNIMLETDEKLEPGAKLSGRLVIIDFGLSKNTIGEPSDEDYLLTIGDSIIRYQQDFANIDSLKPRRGNNQTPFTS